MSKYLLFGFDSGSYDFWLETEKGSMINHRSLKIQHGLKYSYPPEFVDDESFIFNFKKMSFHFDVSSMVRFYELFKISELYRYNPPSFDIDIENILIDVRDEFIDQVMIENFNFIARYNGIHRSSGHSLFTIYDPSSQIRNSKINDILE